MVHVTKRIGFGTTTERFGKLTGHPDLDKDGLYVDRPDGCDPCRYHPQPLHVIFEVNRKGSSLKGKDVWTYKKELEEWSKNLGYRNQKILDSRLWQSSTLGPAWHDVPTKLHDCDRTACMNVGFGVTPRFKPPKIVTPGPGSYYRTVPFSPPYGPHSTRPTFEREELCRFKAYTKKWSLAPNRYNVIDNDSIEQKPKKIVSLRGPYDLFTGKREIKDHSCSAATWPLAFPGCFEDLKKSHLGVMNKTNRDKPYRGRNAVVDLSLCVRKPSEPGPAHYNVDKPSVIREAMYGFNKSGTKPRGYERVLVWPAVGRYILRSAGCGIFGQGHRHVFLSKEPRTIGARLPEKMNTF